MPCSEQFQVHGKTEQKLKESSQVPSAPNPRQSPLRSQHPSTERTLVTTSEPVLTHLYHPSPPFTLEFTLVVRSVGLAGVL